MEEAKIVQEVAEVIVPQLTKTDYMVVGGIFAVGVATGVAVDKFVVPKVKKTMGIIKAKKDAKEAKKNDK